MGKTVKSFYTANAGTIHPIRISQPVLDAQPTAPSAADYTSRISAKVSRSKREMGLRPRGLRCVLIETSGDIQQKSYKFLPILVATNWDTTKNLATIDIDGTEWAVIAADEESGK